MSSTVKSSIDISLSLQKQLMQVGDIVDMFEQRAYNAVALWLEWLKESERILKTYNYSETALLAGIRASILQQESDPATTSKRRIRVANVALGSINTAQNVLFTVNSTLVNKIDTVRNLIRQILVPAQEAGLINGGEEGDLTEYIDNLLQQLKANQQLAPSINNAIALIGKLDVIRIIAEELD